MARMKDDLGKHKAVLVYLNRVDLKRSPSVQELKKELPLKVMVSVSDGAIYAF